MRVPLLNASLTDCVFEVARRTTVTEVNALLRSAADGPLAGILGYEERALVSIDYKDDPRSGIVDALSTMVTDRTQVKILGFYYMANACGRLAGTLLSGLLYQWQGLEACLWASAAFVLVAGLVSLLLPSGQGRRSSREARLA